MYTSRRCSSAAGFDILATSSLASLHVACSHVKSGGPRGVIHTVEGDLLMHSIAILGDFRLHLVTRAATIQSQQHIFGGTALQYRAIEAMLDASDPISRPQVWSPLPERRATCQPIGVGPALRKDGDEALRWELVSSAVEGQPKRRLCLTERKPNGSVCPQPLSFGLLEKLMFGRYGNEDFKRPAATGSSLLEEVVAKIKRKILKGRIFALKDNLSTEFEFPPDKREGEVRRVVDQYVQPKRLTRVILNRADKGTHENCGPDIFVFDDLGLGAGDLKFALPDASPRESPRKFAYEIGSDYLTTYIRFICESDKYINQFSHSLEIYRELEKLGDSLTRTALKGVMGQLLSDASEAAQTGTRHPMGPVLILSAADTLPRLCCDDGANAGEEKTIWQHAHDDPAIRRRTIVLFDAATIRDQLSISSGLSWERTAQDTIIEIKRNKELRPFLRFGHVVIRYGRTGALLISNQSDSDCDYALYFNPDQDDVAYAHKDDGEVLGATSVIVATIIEQLNERCGWRDGAAVLSDIDRALDKAMVLSIQRLLTHFEIGYGDSITDFYDTIETQRVFSESVFSTRAETLKAAGPNAARSPTRVSAQRVRLLPFRSRFWSILAQSSQADLNDVAHNIVLHGPKVTLNTLEDAVDDFVAMLLDHVVVSLRQRCVYLCKPYWSLFLNKEKRSHYYNGPGPDHQVVLKKITTSLASTLDEEGQQGIRRLVGDAFYGSLAEFSKCFAEELATDIEPDDPELKRRWKIGQEFRSSVAKLEVNSSKFDDQLNKLLRLLATGLSVPQHQVSSHVSNYLSQTGQGHDQTHLVLLYGRRRFLKEFKKSRPPRDCYDSCIRTAYGKLRADVRGFLDWSSVTNASSRSDILEVFRSIDDARLADPRRYLHEVLVASIRRFEPGQGWPNPISTPVLRLGKIPAGEANDQRLAVVDRKEVESIRAVKRMIAHYLRDKAERPLSIAVFGPPGAGKSIAVKKIIESIDGEKSFTHQGTINLGQLEQVNELITQFSDIVHECGDGKTPIVFLDEFDSALDTKPLGWLKYFLAVMEDGKLGKQPVEKAILVFAGGTSNTFEDFSLAERSRSDDLWAEFSRMKGPDFVSRLKGHVNVVGINPSTTDDDLYLIRRALALRFMLSQKQDLKDCMLARIDSNMCNAFLHVPYYIHGMRSMRQLVDLCVARDKDGTVAMSEVPPIHQLNMQVDGQAFAALASGLTQPVHS